MDSAALLSQFKVFLRLVRKNLLEQEKLKDLHLQNDLYNKIQYYKAKRDCATSPSLKNSPEKLIYYSTSTEQVKVKETGSQL